MSSAYVPVFRAGEPVRAADLAAVMEAAAGIMMTTGPMTMIQHRGCNHIHPFTRSGTSVPRQDAEGLTAAVAAEMLWQCGPHVARLEGGIMGEMVSAVSAGSGRDVGLHAELTLERVPHDTEHPYTGTLVATSVQWRAAPWAAPVVAEDGQDVWYKHGAIQSGVIMPDAGVRGQHQRALTMWPMPQRAMLVRRQDESPQAGCLALLPSPDVAQVVARHGSGHRFLAALDRLGRLRFGAAAENEETP